MLQMDDNQWKVTKDLIKKYRLNGLLVEFLGMNRAVFIEKLNETRRYKFKDAEKEKIRHYLLCMGKILVGELEK